jgi:hypothetical protein
LIIAPFPVSELLAAELKNDPVAWPGDDDDDDDDNTPQKTYTKTARRQAMM